jgi:ubiquinone/menaquinone biosynthesis C-methylase UbiE
VLELGSGGGFLKEINPRVISSEVFFCSGLDLVSDGMEMPFRDSSLASILMLDVLHHIPRPLDFLKEAARCLMPGGVWP